MFEADLVGYLLDDPGLAGEIDDRLFPLRLDEGVVLPAIAFQLISAPRSYTHDNADQVGTAMTRQRYQFSCWARSALEALTVAAQIVAALSGFTGDLGGIRVVAFIDNELDGYDAETKFYRRTVDAIFTHAEDLGATGS